MKNQKIVIEKKYKGEIFNSGQLVKCINNECITFKFKGDNDAGWDDQAEDNLELGKLYKVIRFDDDKDTGRPRLFIEINKDEDWFYPDRFISIQEDRKIKLKKLIYLCT